ncbi:MAG: ECF-type sigma factor [Lysobacterales bacterium]
MAELTELINQARRGDAAAAEGAFAVVYQELRALARREIGRQYAATLSATGLVHEAYLKLFNDAGSAIDDRQHFFRLCARAMRQILVDEARRRSADKRGGDLVRTEITENLAAEGNLPDLIAIDSALCKLEQRDPELGLIVESYYFAGLTFDEIAAQLGTSDRSVRRDFELARAFLARELA